MHAQPPHCLFWNYWDASGSLIYTPTSLEILVSLLSDILKLEAFSRFVFQPILTIHIVCDASRELVVTYCVIVDFRQTA